MYLSLSRARHILPVYFTVLQILHAVPSNYQREREKVYASSSLFPFLSFLFPLFSPEFVSLRLEALQRRAGRMLADLEDLRLGKIGRHRASSTHREQGISFMTVGRSCRELLTRFHRVCIFRSTLRGWTARILALSLGNAAEDIRPETSGKRVCDCFWQIRDSVPRIASHRDRDGLSIVAVPLTSSNISGT